ncbi:MAG: YdiU family protein [Gammaproteobacteria bacterium]
MSDNLQQFLNLKFDNRFGRLSNQFHTNVKPTPFKLPHYLVSFNQQAAGLIDLDQSFIPDQDFIDCITAKKPFPHTDPLAMLYSGHQFGGYNPQLGDGRAILLTEVINNRGEHWDLQLKGSGLTPYSRDGDGRAVLRSTIREYLCSEAMAGLSIDTTRALCIIGSDDEIYRETIETGAFLIRMAPSHIRFGSFEIFYYRDQHEQLKTLADFTINHYFPDIKNNTSKYVDWLSEVVIRTAKLIAHWQAVGFAHGVMNTDNMSILGLTLDYGPFGFLEKYDPNFICNHSDHSGRYAFKEQPNIGLWNLSCLAQALLPLMTIDDAKSCLALYEKAFINEYVFLMQQKLGFSQSENNDLKLINTLLALLEKNGSDYTRFFRSLSNFSSDNIHDNNGIRDDFIDIAAWDEWANVYCARLKQENSNDQKRKITMNSCNPKFILRNYIAEIAIRKARDEKDYSEIDRLLTVLQNPYDEHPDMQHYADVPPNWANSVAVSCSS